MLAPADTLLGRTLNGYRLTGVLDTGGMSTVYRGERVPASDAAAPDTRPAEVAVKVLHPPAAATHTSQATFRARFRREAEAATTLHHDGIVSVLSYGEDDGLLYMIQPLMRGGSLAARLAAEPHPLPLAQVAAYARQLADALDYAHAHGFVHRDVKPSNVLLDADGRAHLADFGIARVYDPTGGGLALTGDEDDSLTRITTAGEIIGTPAYMSPEQFSGQPVGPASDVYSLGILLYLLVAGQLPFSAETPLAVGMRHLHDTPVFPRLLRPQLPAPAAAAIMRALAKAPQDRFTSTGAFADAFTAGLGGRWIAAGGLQVADPTASLTLGAVPRFAPAASAPGRVSNATPAWRTSLKQSARILPALIATFTALRSRPTAGAAARKAAALAVALLLLLGGIFALAHLPLTPAAVSHPHSSTTHGAPALTATSLPKVAERFVYAGSQLYGETSGGSQVWSFGADSQITHLAVRNGDVIISTAAGTVYTLQGSDGTLLSTYQAPAPKHGKGGGGGGDGGGNGGD